MEIELHKLSKKVIYVTTIIYIYLYIYIQDRQNDMDGDRSWETERYAMRIYERMEGGGESVKKI